MTAAPNEPAPTGPISNRLASAPEVDRLTNADAASGCLMVGARGAPSAATEVSAQVPPG
jgi:hypothetical protein